MYSCSCLDSFVRENAMRKSRMFLVSSTVLLLSCPIPALYLCLYFFDVCVIWSCSDRNYSLSVEWMKLNFVSAKLPIHCQAPFKIQCRANTMNSDPFKIPSLLPSSITPSNFDEMPGQFGPIYGWQIAGGFHMKLPIWILLLDSVLFSTAAVGIFWRRRSRGFAAIIVQTNRHDDV